MKPQRCLYCSNWIVFDIDDWDPRHAAAKYCNELCSRRAARLAQRGCDTSVVAHVYVSADQLLRNRYPLYPLPPDNDLAILEAALSEQSGVRVRIHARETSSPPRFACPSPQLEATVATLWQSQFKPLKSYKNG